MTRPTLRFAALIAIAALLAPRGAWPQRAAPGDQTVTTPEIVPEEGAQPAVTPSVVFYQGRLTDLGGLPRTGTVTLMIALYADAATPTPLWTETHNLVPLTDGVFSLLLGSLTVFPANAWSEPDRYLGISVDGAPELLPRLRVASVPFALEANRLNGKRSVDFEPIGGGAIAAAGLASQLKGSDGDPPNAGSNQVHWGNLYGVPEGFVDGMDDIGVGVAVHGQLQGLDANDHPQYALGAALQTSDGSAPNLGSNRVHWDNLGGVPAPLVNQLIPAEWIEAGSLDSTRVAAGGLAGSNLAPGTVVGDRLAPGSVGAAQVADASLTGTKIANESLTADDIQNGTISSLDIQDESIFTNDIKNGTILGADLAPGSVGPENIEDGAVQTEDLAPGSVTASAIADSTIPGSKLTTGAVTAREIAPDAVTGANVVNGSLSSADQVDAPGVAFLNLPGFVTTVDDLNGITIQELTIHVPGPGFVIVHGAAQVFLLHDLGTTSRVTLALSTLPDDVPDSTSAEIALPGNYPSQLYLFPIVTQNVFPVMAAGSVNFFLTAKRGGQPREPSLHNVRIQATFVPKGY